MKKILLLSDTHSYIDDRILEYTKSVDEIWHCGDFGSMEVIEKLEQKSSHQFLKAVSKPEFAFSLPKDLETE